MSEQNQGEATLRELAIRLLSPQYPGAEFMRVTDLLPGQLPANPPAELALPPDARLIGSVVRGQDVTVLFDTQLTSEQLLAFYRERASAAGWTEQEPFPGPRGNGFVQTMPRQMAHALFFATSHGPSLRLMASSGAGDVTEAQLTLETEPNRHGQGPLRQRMNQEMEIVPPLVAPEGALQRGMGGGGGGGEWRTNAELTTDLDLAAITAHYTAQLEGANWRAGSRGEGDRVSWSVWDFADQEGEPWRGYLFIFQQPDDPHRYFLDIHCRWSGASASGGGGWFTSYAPLTSR